MTTAEKYLTFAYAVIITCIISSFALVAAGGYYMATVR